MDEVGTETAVSAKVFGLASSSLLEEPLPYHHAMEGFLIATNPGRFLRPMVSVLHLR